MKIIVTEKQLSRLVFEQENEFNMPGQPERYGFDWKKPETLRPALKKQEESFQSLNIDDTIDIVSAVIDGIPGIGNLVSAGIDVIHTISYAIRFYFANELNKKIEYGTLSFITLGATFIPIEGNSLPIIARRGISSVLKETPAELLKLAKKLGIYNGVVILLKKEPWKYNILLALCKIFGSKISENLIVVNQKLSKIYDKIKNDKNISEPVLFLKNLTSEYLTYVDVAKTLSSGIS